MQEQTYLVDFVCGGKMLTSRIEAASWKEAEERLEAIRETGRISGCLLMEGEAGGNMSAQAGRC